MISTEWKLEMRLKSHQMLQQYMEFKDMKVRTLARAAGVSRSTIGHLHSGARSSTRRPSSRPSRP